MIYDIIRAYNLIIVCNQRRIHLLDRVEWSIAILYYIFMAIMSIACYPDVCHVYYFPSLAPKLDLARVNRFPSRL